MHFIVVQVSTLIRRGMSKDRKRAVVKVTEYTEFTKTTMIKDIRFSTCW